VGSRSVLAIFTILVGGGTWVVIQTVAASEKKLIEVKPKLAQLQPRQTLLEKRLRAIGFEDDRDSYMIGKRHMVLKDLCKILHCQPRDFKSPISPSWSTFPPMDFLAPNARILQRPGYSCHIWFLDPRNLPKDLDEAEVQVGFYLYGTEEAVRGANQF